MQRTQPPNCYQERGIQIKASVILEDSLLVISCRKRQARLSNAAPCSSKMPNVEVAANSNLAVPLLCVPFHFSTQKVDRQPHLVDRKGNSLNPTWPIGSAWITLPQSKWHAAIQDLYVPSSLLYTRCRSTCMDDMGEPFAAAGRSAGSTMLNLRSGPTWRSLPFKSPVANGDDAADDPASTPTRL